MNAARPSSTARKTQATQAVHFNSGRERGVEAKGDRTRAQHAPEKLTASCWHGAHRTFPHVVRHTVTVGSAREEAGSRRISNKTPVLQRMTGYNDQVLSS